MLYAIIASDVANSLEKRLAARPAHIERLQQLKAEGRAYKVGKFPFTANSRAKINHETEGFAKVIADANTDEVLGVHLVGPSVSEMIGEFCVAMEFSASAEDIALTCHPHPTRSEALRQAAMNVEGMAMQI